MELAYKNITGVEEGEIFGSISINIFPNPATNIIEVSGFKPELFGLYDAIQIINTRGECVLQVELTPSSVQRIDVSSLPAGMYFVRVGGETKKFVKM
jgi:hypothetical protein